VEVERIARFAPEREKGEWILMRFMISARCPNERLNALLKEGKFPQTFQSIMEELQPEAAYFTDVEGARGAYLVVNLDDASELASKTEPLFQGLDATIQINLVSTLEDVQRAMPAFEQAAQKFG
jgi:hypothetical protein